MKRVLTWVGAVLGVLVVAVLALWYVVFGKNAPIVDGAEVAPGVHTVKEGFVSVYLLDAGPGKVALIDAGKDDSAGAILDALAQRSLGPAAVAAIFLTHGHGDHTAGCAKFPSAAIYAMESETPMLSGMKLAKPLHDGDAIDVGDLHVEAFAVPGHTPGSAAYLARGVLFFGDSAGASKSGEMMKAVPLTSKSSTENVASLKALESRLAPRAGEIKALAFAHTGPMQGFAPFETFAKR